ncbi:hypothetical protein L6164_001952 [Bauhinia variegata]|uniref:Uncharacterized protein n=1 Tax=Bauhinia variegata TaxID=167791 RepID=A0ACB9QB32_BAUVA|nr:hypothetical protein L6164_001952 [Bauhinia variegata]
MRKSDGIFGPNVELARFIADAEELLLWPLQAVIFSYINMDPRRMDPRYSGEILKHLDKQNELLMEAYKSMLNEVQKLQVEEEMLMRKLYEIMSAHGLTKKNVDNCNASNGSQGDLSNATVNAANEQ